MYSSGTWYGSDGVPQPALFAVEVAALFRRNCVGRRRGGCGPAISGIRSVVGRRAWRVLMLSFLDAARLEDISA